MTDPIRAVQDVPLPTYVYGRETAADERLVPLSDVGLYRDAVLAALRAALPGLREAPAGWKMVPVEPTADMRNAYHAVTDDDVTMKGAAGSRWAAMLAAAPSAAGLREAGEPVAPCSAIVACDCPSTLQCEYVRRHATPPSPEPDLATPSGGQEAGPEEDRIEAAYWRFDARHKGYGDWKHAPMSERDAFKAEMRNALGAEKVRAEMRLVARGWRRPDAPAKPVNSEGPAELCPEPAPGLSFDAQGVLRPIAEPASDLVQRMYDEASQCDVFGITKPAALLREAADALQHAANMQAMGEFAEVVTAGHLSDAAHAMRDLLLLARSEIYHEPECMPGEPCNCGKGELMRRIDDVLRD